MERVELMLPDFLIQQIKQIQFLRNGSLLNGGIFSNLSAWKDVREKKNRLLYLLKYGVNMFPIRSLSRLWRL